MLNELRFHDSTHQRSAGSFVLAGTEGLECTSSVNSAYLVVPTVSSNPIISLRGAIIVVLSFRLSLILNWNDSRSYYGEAEL